MAEALAAAAAAAAAILAAEASLCAFHREAQELAMAGGTGNRGKPRCGLPAADGGLGKSKAPSGGGGGDADLGRFLDAGEMDLGRGGRCWEADSGELDLDRGE